MSVNYLLEKLTPEEFPVVVADEITMAIEDAIEDKGVCNLVVAGGKTPAAVYRLLGLPPRSQSIQWDKVRIFWGDERMVPHADSASNYNMLRETLIDQVDIPEENIIAVDTSLPLKDAACDYQKRIHEALNLAEGESPVFDIVMLGIGEDGHIASLFPNSENLEEMQATVVSASDEKISHDRISLSPKAIFSATAVYFLVTGNNKSDILKELFSADESNFQQYPALLFHQCKGRVSWFVDHSAAKQLSDQA